MIERILILGAGGYGLTVDDVAHQMGYSNIVLDDADSAILFTRSNPISTLRPILFLLLAIMLSGWSG